MTHFVLPRDFLCWGMNWHEVLKAAFQIPCCFSAALLIMASARAALRELCAWLARPEY